MEIKPPESIQIFGKPVLSKRRTVIGKKESFELGVPNMQSLASGLVCDKNNSVKKVFTSDDPKLRFNVHSAIKPFHAGLLIKENEKANKRFSLTTEELAALASSHSGSKAHIVQIISILEKANINESVLATRRPPIDEDTRNSLIRKNPGPNPLSNLPAYYDQCSGHHSGQLLRSKLNGFPLEDYNKHDKDLQKLYLRDLIIYSGDEDAKIVAYDNCKTPTFEVSLPAFAALYARFLDDEDFKPVIDAMITHPVLVECDGSLSSELMRVTKGRLVSKGGAEGSIVIMDKKSGDALVLKEWSGELPFRDRVTIKALEDLRWLKKREAATLFNMKPFALHDEDTGIVYELKKKLWE